MDKSDKQLADILKAMFEASLPGGTVTVVPLSVNGITHDEKEVLSNQMEKFDSLPDGTNEIKEKFLFTLVGMAQWAVAHPSTSRYEYLSPGEIKSNKNLKNAFMAWWYNEHPGMKPEQEKMFNQSIKDGMFPGGVMEHTADGHHPIGWSWGSEWYIADFYMCLIRALIQHAEKAECDMKDKNAPVYIANKAFQLNRVDPTPEIIKAMNERLHETVETREYSEYSAGVRIHVMAGKLDEEGCIKL
jgi:hypothetical protein